MQLMLARAGAVFYVVWGVLHIWAAWKISELALAQEGLVQGRLLQLAAYMLGIAATAIVVAVWLNWRNDRVGYWVNLAVVSFADIAFLLVIVLPGYVPLGRGLIGPALWVVALICTTLAQRDRAAGIRA